jgi:uncharacterized damage-inducible protein DinB
MEFELSKSLEVLGNTPNVVIALLQNLSDDWVNCKEGEDTWSVKEVVAHLIHCEETDWLPRMRIILNSPEIAFNPIDMQAHFSIANNNSINEMLVKFKQLRQIVIKELKDKNLRENDLLKKGIHPIIGEGSLQQLIATWVAHDLSHKAQIARIMAKQNKELVGGFKQYLKILN